MNQIEVISYLIGLGFFLIFPLIAQSVGLRFILKHIEIFLPWNVYLFVSLMVLTMICSIFFIINLSKKLCTRCIYFSCPLNRVPKEIIVQFIEINPEYSILKS
jgi:hypothetical protein